MKKINIKYLLLSVICAVAISCKNDDIFDKTDHTQIPNTIFSNEASINLYLARTYDLVMPTWPIPGTIHNTSDETNSAYTPLLYGQLTVNSVLDLGSKNQNPNPAPWITAGNTNNNGDIYYLVRRCNIAIDQIEAGTLPRATKSQLKGQFYFMRAYIYFYIIKLYGGMPLILHSQALSDDLFQARNKTSECIKQITTDLDSCMGLPVRWPLATDGGKITKDAALAFKGKVLLYWASPQFNPTDDRSRWKTAYDACKLAYTTCVTDGYALQANFTDIFTNESSNTERLIWRTLDAVTVGRGTNIEALTRPASEGGAGAGYHPTWNMVQMFPDTNGLYITDAGTVYDSELFWRKRDPRFNATIAYNGGRWDLSGKLLRRQWNYNGDLDDAGTVSISNTGFYCKKMSNPNLSTTAVKYDAAAGGGNGMDWIEMRFAEVIMNYAEAANGNDLLAESQQALALIRKRAGILQGSSNYGINIDGFNRPSMFKLIWNERAVEFAMEGKRYDDLRRTRQFTALNGTARLAYVWGVNSPYVAGAKPATPVAGKIYMDVPDAVTGKRIRDTININNRDVYRRFFIPSTISLEGTGATSVINYPDYYYFYAIPNSFINSDPILEQTLGWPGGTFDPLK